MATSDDRQVILGNEITLEIIVRNALGTPTDADSLPELEIVDADGNVMREQSTDGVLRVGTGIYKYVYTVPEGSKTGIWYDQWSLQVNGLHTEASLNFVVLSQSTSVSSVGPQIGDEPVQSYSEAEINCINSLLEKLKMRLRSKLYSEVVDEYGNTTFEECNVFSNDELVYFLELSLSEFNSVPHFTEYTFACICDLFSHLIVEGAWIFALAAIGLSEQGKMWQISDNGITTTPPDIAGYINTQLSTFMTNHREQVKFAKASIKPNSLGIGTFRLGTRHPGIARLRHLRGRRFF